MTALRPRTCRLVLTAAVLLSLGRLLWCDFTWWDDPYTIHHNPKLNPFVTAAAFESFWTEPAASIYIPLTHTVWAALTWIARVPPDLTGITLNPQIFHAANLLVHLGGALAVFELLRRVLPRPTPAPVAQDADPAAAGPMNGAASNVPALLGAMFWAVHPLQVESVGWVSGLKDVLSGSLVVAALAAFVAFRHGGRKGLYVASVVLFAAALLAKPAAMTMPLLLVLIDRFALATPWRDVGRAAVAFVLLTLPVAAVARLAQLAPASAAPAGVRVLLVGDTLAFYAVKTVAPVTLTFDYGRDVNALRGGRELGVAWLLPTGVAAGAVLLYRRARRRGRPLSPLPAVGLGVFALAPLPVLGVTRFDFQVVSTVADHYAYVALLGPALMGAWAAARWPRAAGAAVGVIAVLGVRSAGQCAVWQDSDTLFSHALRVNPRSWSSYVNLATLAGHRRDREAAERYIDAAARVARDDPTVLINLVGRYAQAGDAARADAAARKLIAAYEATWVPAGWPPAGAHVLVVNALINSDQPEAAAAFLQEGLARDNADPRLHVAADRLRWKR